MRRYTTLGSGVYNDIYTSTDKWFYTIATEFSNLRPATASSLMPMTKSPWLKASPPPTAQDCRKCILGIIKWGCRITRTFVSRHICDTWNCGRTSIQESIGCRAEIGCFSVIVFSLPCREPPIPFPQIWRATVWSRRYLSNCCISVSVSRFAIAIASLFCLHQS